MAEYLIEWAAAAQVQEGETLSGDRYLVRPDGDRTLVAVIDGIGHGPEAAAASQIAVATLERHADQPLALQFAACHKALHGSRGVVMTVASFDVVANKLMWLGVGNVEGRLLRADPNASHPEEVLLLRNGVVGDSLPATLAISALSIERKDVLILATDGIRREFTRGLHVGQSAHQIANDVLAKHGKGTDDALVIVAKYRGGDSAT